MKKFLVFIIILFSSNVLAHMNHYKKFNKIEMDIFRNGELIGYNYYFFTRKGEETTITNQVKFSVKLCHFVCAGAGLAGRAIYFRQSAANCTQAIYVAERGALAYCGLLALAPKSP